MNNLANYYSEYDALHKDGSVTTDATACWIPWNEPYDYYFYPFTIREQERNKTEQAFKILKLLVGEKIIREPTSFKKFCDLIEKLAKVI